MSNHPFGVILKHELFLGFGGLGKIFDYLIKIYFNKTFIEKLDKHCKIEWFKLADYLNLPLDN